MKYRVLNNGKAVLLSYAPEKISGSLELEFLGETAGVFAVLNTGERVIYRELREGRCFIERGLLDEGALKVSLTAQGELSLEVRCDALQVVKTSECDVVFPDVTDGALLARELRIENDEIRDAIGKADERIGELERKFAEVYEGYDLL